MCANPDLPTSFSCFPHISAILQLQAACQTQLRASHLSPTPLKPPHHHLVPIENSPRRPTGPRITLSQSPPPGTSIIQAQKLHRNRLHWFPRCPLKIKQWGEVLWERLVLVHTIIGFRSKHKGYPTFQHLFGGSVTLLLQEADMKLVVFRYFPLNSSLNCHHLHSKTSVHPPQFQPVFPANQWHQV